MRVEKAVGCIDAPSGHYFVLKNISKRSFIATPMKPVRDGYKSPCQIFVRGDFVYKQFPFPINIIVQDQPDRDTVYPVEHTLDDFVGDGWDILADELPDPVEQNQMDEDLYIYFHMMGV